MKKELRVKLFGNERFDCGHLVEAMSIKKFEKMFNVKVDYSTVYPNEYGSFDYVADNDFLTIKIEVEDNKITHILDIDCVYGTVESEEFGTLYLKQDAFCDNFDQGVRYYANAVDLDGNNYKIAWDIKDTWEYDAHEYNDDGNCINENCFCQCEDESDACDWDYPVEITKL